MNNEKVFARTMLQSLSVADTQCGSWCDSKQQSSAFRQCWRKRYGHTTAGETGRNG